MARTDPQLNFRIPAELKERLERAATQNQRTLTGELIARLERSFSDAPAVNGITMSAIFEKLQEIESSINTGKFARTNPYERLTSADAAKKAKTPSKSRP